MILLTAACFSNNWPKGISLKSAAILLLKECMQLRKRLLISTKEQPAFNRQFDLLIKNLQDYEKKQYNIFIFADNPKQLERLHIILPI
jgi:hypothetical protein